MESDLIHLRMHCPPPQFHRFLLHPTNLPNFSLLKSTQIYSKSSKPPFFINFHRLNSNSIALRISESKPITKVESFQHRQSVSSSKELLIKLSVALQECASESSCNEGRSIHAYLIKNGIRPDVHLWNCLVNFYSKCGSARCAQNVFDEMPNRDVVSWNALIDGFVREGNDEKALILFRDMWQKDVGPNGFVFTTVLKACSKCLALNLGKQVHGEVIKFGLLSDLVLGSALVDLYAKCGELELTKKAFRSMPEHNSVSWNALLNGYARGGDGKEVLRLFRRMMDMEIKLNKFNLSTIIKGCASLGDKRLGRSLHCLATKIGSEIDGFTRSCLVNLYSKCGLAEDAYKVFVRIGDPDVVAWTAMISCFEQQGENQQAAMLFREMGRFCVQPNDFTLASAVSAASGIGNVQYGNSIHAYIGKLGLEIDNAVGNALIMMHMDFGNVQDGYRVFSSLVDRDLVSWNALLSGFHNGSDCEGAMRIFHLMLQENFVPNKYTFVSILRSCASLVAANYGHLIHAHIIKGGLQMDPFVGTALVDMYAKCGHLDDAVLVFNDLDERDVFTWTVIITGYSQTDQGEEALKCFRQMQREGVRANEFTVASCLRACSSLAILDNGRQFHSWTVKTGQTCDKFVASALGDMYGKSGCIKDAEAVFDDLVERDTIAWNTIICTYSQHGLGTKALEVFKCMLDEGARPDDVTFIGVLSACSHVGLVEEGRLYFNSLSKIYGITPTMEHYACMVDILGRAGKLDGVKHFIEEMTLVPDALIWQTVLGACRMHCDVGLGERAAQKLFELEPEMDSTYTLLSNIYASMARWDDVAKVRAKMSYQGVKKEPGCSWIDVDGHVHIFLAQDGSHPKTKEIYLKLDELNCQLSLIGYTPNTNLVLHNVADVEKKENLLYHSERLALAYGLITSNHGKVIRIFKNLRICVDCHTAIKLISTITDREIVVRDIRRFHHFQNGSCSCGDYW